LFKDNTDLPIKQQIIPTTTIRITITMADSISQPFQRFNISAEDLDAANNSASAEASIPILTRSIEAKTNSVKLRQISPVCVLVVGMAGSGKTTLMAALQRSLRSPEGGDSSENDDKKNDNDGNNEDNNDDDGDEHDEKNDDKDGKSLKEAPSGYCLNLDPATKLVPFGASIDIRDTVDYKVSCYSSTIILSHAHSFRSECSE
jgi:hypothetical protein